MSEVEYETLFDLNCGVRDFSRKDFPRSQIISRGSRVRKTTSWDLRGLKMDYSILTGARLTSINLVGSSFRYSQAQSADFMMARLCYVDFTGSCLVGANFTAAWVKGMIVEGVDLHGAVMPEGWRGEVVGCPARLP